MWVMTIIVCKFGILVIILRINIAITVVIQLVS
jgi:hypothetical protein